MASQAACGPEVVTDGVTGLLADPGSPEHISEQVIRLLEDRELACTLGKNAREHAEHFLLPTVLDMNIRAYEDLLKPLPSRSATSVAAESLA